MVTLLSFEFWGDAFLFLIYSYFIFYLPGRFFLQHVQLTSFQKNVLSFSLGMVLWAIQAFIFGYLQLRWLSYVYIVVFFFLAIKFRFIPFGIHTFKIPQFRVDKLLVFLVVIGMFVQLVGVWTMGLQFENGMRFCCGHVPDNLLEISITNEIVHRFPPFEPGMYGVVKQNYHYWSHLLMGDFVRVTQLPLVPTVNQYFSVVISLLLGLLAIVFAQLLRLKKSFVYFFLFFLYFGADLVYFFPVFSGHFPNFSIGSMEDGTKFLVNYPRAFAVVFYLLAISLFSLWIHNKKKYEVLLLSFLVFGTLIGFKVYVGFFGLLGIAAFAAYSFFKKDFRVFFLCSIPFLISLVIYLPGNSNAGGLEFMGFWRVNDFVSNPNLGLSHLELSRRVFESAGNNKTILFEALFLFMFIIGTFGARLVGLLQTKSTIQQVPQAIHYLLIPAMTVSFLIGLLFWQKTGGSNTFNFLVNVLLFSSFYSALAVSYVFEKRDRKIFLALFACVLLFTLPRIFSSTYGAITSINKNYTIIPAEELVALSFLKDNTSKDSLVAVSSFFHLEHNAPYVPFLADRPSFFSGKDNELIAHGIDHKARENSWKTIFFSPYPLLIRKELQKGNIDFLYLSPKENIQFYKSKVGLTEVFRSKEVVILETPH